MSESIMEKWEREARERLAEALNEKGALMADLAKLGVAFVRVDYDGCGDSGQIGAIVANNDRRPEAGEAGTIELAPPMLMRIENACYTFLQSKHAGWENNEGAFGEFVFDVAAQSIALEHNTRVETYETENHTF